MITLPILAVPHSALLTILELLIDRPLLLIAPALGASLASFLCVAAERAPRGLSINGRSKCVCGRQLQVWRNGRPENVPIAGWLAARGRTDCGTTLPAVYLSTEVVAAVGFTAAAVLLPTLGALAGFAVISAVVFALAYQQLAP